MPSRLAVAGLGLVAIICMASRSQLSVDRNDIRHRALDSAKSIAKNIDAEVGTTESLLNRLAAKFAINHDNVAANDALLRLELSALPKSVANILLLSADGRNIGNAVGNHAGAGDRDYFKRASAGDQLVVEAPIRSRSDVGWVIPIARRISNRDGLTQAVLVVAISVESIRNLISPADLPAGSLVRVVTEDEVQIAFSSGIARNGPDLNRMGNAPRQFRLAEGSELLTLDGKAVRAIGFSRTQRVPWLVTVGLPVEAISESSQSDIRCSATNQTQSQHSSFVETAASGGIWNCE